MYATRCQTDHSKKRSVVLKYYTCHNAHIPQFSSGTFYACTVSILD